jgi:pimeloyl-ACP methyl ester carboxylesterase
VTVLDKSLELMDRPEITYRLFFPRREEPGEQRPHNGTAHFVAVADDISIGCMFYPAGKDSPNILYFHGNGEIASDYDYVAPLYQQHGINLFVADYRGYGASDGSPSCTAMIKDALPIFEAFVAFLDERGFRGGLFVMGRSLGSAPAIEVAYRCQQRVCGLIVESGFASQRNQLERLGVTHLFGNIAEAVGFGNDVKIGQVRIPTLIIHGEEDEIIPATEGRALLALSGAEQKRGLFVRGAGHNDLFERDGEEYVQSIVAFTSNCGNRFTCEQF